MIEIVLAAAAAFVIGLIVGAFIVYCAYDQLLDRAHQTLRDVLLNPLDRFIARDAWKIVRKLDATKP